LSYLHGDSVYPIGYAALLRFSGYPIAPLFSNQALEEESI